MNQFVFESFLSFPLDEDEPFDAWRLPHFLRVEQDLSNCSSMKLSKLFSKISFDDESIDFFRSTETTRRRRKEFRLAFRRGKDPRTQRIHECSMDKDDDLLSPSKCKTQRSSWAGSSQWWSASFNWKEDDQSMERDKESEENSGHEREVQHRSVKFAVSLSRHCVLHRFDHIPNEWRQNTSMNVFNELCLSLERTIRCSWTERWPNNAEKFFAFRRFVHRVIFVRCSFFFGQFFDLFLQCWLDRLDGDLNRWFFPFVFLASIINPTSCQTTFPPIFPIKWRRRRRRRTFNDQFRCCCSSSNKWLDRWDVDHLLSDVFNSLKMCLWTLNDACQRRRGKSSKRKWEEKLSDQRTTREKIDLFFVKQSKRSPDRESVPVPEAPVFGLDRNRLGPNMDLVRTGWNCNWTWLEPITTGTGLGQNRLELEPELKLELTSFSKCRNTF